MTRDANPNEAQAKKAGENEESLLTIEFAGMVSFVKRPGEVFALLVAPHRSSVRRPKLCQHHPYLVFPADSETFDVVEGGEFYTSFLGIDGRPYGLWNIDGCHFEILPGGQRNPDLDAVSRRDSFRDRVLDLDSFAKSSVDPWWLEPEALADRDILASRFRLRHGILESSKQSDSPWLMRTEEQGRQGLTGNLRARAREQTEVVVYRIESEHRYVVLKAKTADGAFRTVQLKRGAKIQVANLCPVKPGHPGIERDVMAFYDLCSDPLHQEDRQYPHTLERLAGDVSVGTTACPPVQQTGGED